MAALPELVDDFRIEAQGTRKEFNKSQEGEGRRERKRELGEERWMGLVCPSALGSARMDRQAKCDADTTCY
jgi:hypothetical protein